MVQPRATTTDDDEREASINKIQVMDIIKINSHLAEEQRKTNKLIVVANGQDFIDDVTKSNEH